LVYFKLGEYQQSTDCGKQALSFAKEVGNRGAAEEAYRLLSSLYGRLGESLSEGLANNSSGKESQWLFSLKKDVLGVASRQNSDMVKFVNKALKVVFSSGGGRVAFKAKAHFR